jgi:hypothetical protein
MSDTGATAINDNPDEAVISSPLPPCRKCGCDDLAVIEHHHGTGEWYDVMLDRDGFLVLDDHNSASVSSPTGAWTIRCLGCDHEWPTKRRPA